MSLNISLIVFPAVTGKGAHSVVPNRVRMDRDSLSPEPLAKQGDSIYSIIHSFNHSFIHVCWSPQKGAPLHSYRKNIRSPSTEPPTDIRPTYKGCGLVPQGDRNDIAISTPVPCILQHNIFHPGFGRPEPR